MIWFKSCPRCTTGDLTLESDMHGSYVMCLACGFFRDVDASKVASLSRDTRPRKAAAA